MTTFTRQITTITLPLALRALEAAMAEAERRGLCVSVCIVNAAGLPILTAHMDGATLQCREMALGKALTAVGYGIPTNCWEARLADRSQAVRQGLPLQAGLVLFGGGEPFQDRGEMLGAIGVSGASEAEDVLCAQMAAERVKKLLEPLDLK